MITNQILTPRQEDILTEFFDRSNGTGVLNSSAWSCAYLSGRHHHLIRKRRELPKGCQLYLKNSRELPSKVILYFMEHPQTRKAIAFNPVV